MTTPSGTIKFSDIEDEFGQTPNQRLGDYRVNYNVGDFATLQGLPLDDGVPQSGPIKFSDLQSKKLNIIVDYYTVGNVERGNDPGVDFKIDNRYNSGAKSAIQPVGATSAEIPAESTGTAGKKVRVVVGDKIGSVKATATNNTTQKNRCALRTGTNWHTDTELTVHVTEGGLICGAGGDGGNGGNGVSGENNDGVSGKSGSSALGIQFNGTKVKVDSGGYIIAGFGGGGGGGGDHTVRTQTDCDNFWNWECETDTYTYKAGGGGGGGGAGRPRGTKGEGGSASGGSSPKPGSDGGNGNDYDSPFTGNWQSTGGSNGEGGSNDHNSVGGDGGGGGKVSEFGSSDGGNGRSNAEGGENGAQGGAINRSSNTIDWAFVDNSSGNRVFGEGSNGKSESENTVA